VGIFSDTWQRIRTNQRQVTIEYRAATAGGMIPAWTAGRPTWLPATYETYDQGAYRRVPLIFRCVQYLANEGATAPIRVYDPTDEPDNDHPLRRLLVQPNPGMGEGRFLSFVIMNIAVTSFCVIEKERDRLGNVIGLWPLRSDWIRPIPRSQAQPDWEYRVPGRDPVTLKSDDVIPVTYADTPDGSPVGIGPMEAALREAQITGALTDFVKVFMDRGAIPLYMLIPSDDPKLAAQFKDPAVKASFLDAWKQKYQGLHNAGEPLLSPGIKDIQRIGLDMNELAYADLNDRIDAAICAAFGISPMLVGAPIGLQHSTYSNYGEARESFYTVTMNALWSRIDDAFTRQLLPEFIIDDGWDIRFDTSEHPAFQEDRDAAVTRAVAAFTSGLVSRYTAQIDAGYDIHGADEFLIPFNMVPVANSTPNGQRSVTGWVHPLLTLPTHDPTAPRFVYRDGRRYVNEMRLSPAEREQRAAIVATNRQHIDALGDLIAPRLESFFAAQADRVTEQLGLRAIAGNGQHETRAVEQIDWSNEDDALLRLFGQWWDTVSEAALSTTESLIDSEITWAVANPYLADVQGVLAQRVVGINATTRTAIEDTITRLLTDGTTVPDMGAAISDLFAQTYANRHLAVARTESMMAYGTASTMAYQASGVVDRAQLHDNASHTDGYGASDGLTCAQRNNLVVPLSQVQRHLSAEHPNGTLSVSPVLSTPLGEV
jgi:HK97 family phage portal protein